MEINNPVVKGFFFKVDTNKLLQIIFFEGGVTLQKDINLHTNKKKDILSMKALQELLNELKAFRSKEINPKVKKVEQTDSVSTITHIRGSLLGMHPVALFLLLANKLPFINRITKRLQAYYGRTSIWRMLVIFRKIFIAMNAVIGVYTVFRLTGLSTDTILANFIGMGVSYIEILSNFTHKLFHWIFDFFDYKVVPNVPKDNGWWGGPKSATWANRY